MAITLIIALTFVVTSPANAHADSKNLNIVMVHGVWADAPSWNGVTARLQADGYTVYAVPNPLRGLSSDAAYVASILSTITGPMVLVGHSYGGAVITNAATGNSNVKALVYIDAFVPDQTEIACEISKRVTERQVDSVLLLIKCLTSH